MKNTILLLALGLFSAFAGLTPSSAAPATGENAPDFTLPGLDGKTHSLADYKGKFIVLEWYNPDCPFVHKQYDSGTMQALQKEYTGKGVIWLSINSSAPGKQGCYEPAEYQKIAQERAAAPTALLLDHDGKVGHLYDAKTTPDIYIIDPAGKLIYQGAIDSTPSPDPTDIPLSTNYVRSTLDAALAGQPVTVGTTRPYGCGVKY